MFFDITTFGFGAKAILTTGVGVERRGVERGGIETGDSIGFTSFEIGAGIVLETGLYNEGNQIVPPPPPEETTGAGAGIGAITVIAA